MISVVIPFFNSEKYISRCIQSVLEQKYKNFELILIDDGSTDKSEIIVREYDDSRIKFIKIKHAGVSAARNEGVSKATGEYITFVDADDCIHPEFLQELYGELKKYDADITVCGEEDFKNDVFAAGEKKYNFEGTKLVTNKEACCLIYTGLARRATYVRVTGKLYKKSLFEESTFPNGKIHEDQFVSYKIQYKAKTIVEVGACLYGYRLNEKSITHTDFKIERYDDIEACENAIRFFEVKNELDISRMAVVRKHVLVAKYSVMARKSGVYKSVPLKYRLSVRNAKKIIKEFQGLDAYEYFLYKYYPNRVKIEAVMRKITGWLKNKRKKT